MSGTTCTPALMISSHLTIVCSPPEKSCNAANESCSESGLISRRVSSPPCKMVYCAQLVMLFRRKISLYDEEECISCDSTSFTTQSNQPLTPSFVCSPHSFHPRRTQITKQPNLQHPNSDAAMNLSGSGVITGRSLWPSSSEGTLLETSASQGRHQPDSYDQISDLSLNQAARDWKNYVLTLQICTFNGSTASVMQLAHNYNFHVPCP